MIFSVGDRYPAMCLIVIDRTSARARTWVKYLRPGLSSLGRCDGDDDKKFLNTDHLRSQKQIQLRLSVFMRQKPIHFAYKRARLHFFCGAAHLTESARPRDI